MHFALKIIIEHEFDITLQQSDNYVLHIAYSETKH